MSDGVTTFQPVVLPKIKFNIPEEERATQEDQIEWQTTTLAATIMRDDTEDKNWRYRGEEFDSEAAAEEALKEKLGVTISG